MREIYLFIAAACLVATVFFVSLIELILTVHRRKVNSELERQIKGMRAGYIDALNRVVLEDESRMETVEKEASGSDEVRQKEKEQLEKQYQEKIEDITKNSERALETAKAKAKKLQEEARKQADEYVNERKKEVEEELMNLVISVSKKVLPTGISYEAQKELVMRALRDVKIESEEE